MEGGVNRPAMGKLKVQCSQDTNYVLRPQCPQLQKRLGTKCNSHHRKAILICLKDSLAVFGLEERALVSLQSSTDSHHR
eukprot:6482775-Amphidinium_carterae.1